MESVFGTESKITRKLFLSRITEETNNWILDSELIRRRVKRYLRAKK